MSARGISDTEVLRAVLAGGTVRVALLDRAGHFLLDPDPNPPISSDHGAPPDSNLLELYGELPGVFDALQNAFVGSEVQLTRQQGGATYALRFLPRRNPNGDIDAVFVVAAIITEGSLVEHALADLQAREQRIFNSNMLGLIYWNESGAITDANDTFLTMVGYTREDLAEGRLDWRAMTPPEYRTLDELALTEVRERGVCASFEKEYLHKDGRRVQVLLGGASWQSGHMSGVAFVIDISARKQSERARVEAQETLQRVLDAAPIVLWSVDAAGVFTLATGRGLQGLGLAPGELVGQSLFERYAAMPDVISAVRRCLAGEELFETVKLSGLVLENRYTPLRNAAGIVSGVLGIAIDVTERRRAESEQEELRAQLLQAQKLESLGLLAGGIAHDFNNILTPILGAASTALLTIPSDNPAHADIQTVIASAQRAAGLTRQMLAYSGKAQGEIRPIDLSTQIRAIASLLETTIPKKVQLRLELGSGLPAIEADTAQIDQVIMNLVINAAEAIGDQPGTVLVSTGRQTLDESCVAALFAAEDLAAGEYVLVEVHDTGHGMDEVTKHKIFDPFFTTKFTGRGLGLAAVLGIVRAHRGAIKVYSTHDQGTTFKVYFPITLRPLPIEPRHAGLDYRGHGLVLVIDDDRGVRHVARKMLEHFGFNVVEAEDGKAGTEAFAARVNEFDLVIVDMTMPKMNGEETFRAIRCIRSDLPVILMSGYNEIEATRLFTSKGLAGFIEKPFTPTDLARKLATVLGLRR